MSGSNCCFLAFIHVSQETGNIAWYSHFFENIPQFVVIHIVRGFNIVNEAEIDEFMEFLCFICCPTNVGNLISRSSTFSKPSLYIWKFLFHVLLKPTFKDFEHCLDNMWNEHNCMVVWTLLDIALLWYWNENWIVPVFWLLLRFPNLLTYWVQPFNSIIF